MIATKIEMPFREFLESLKVPSAPRMVVYLRYGQYLSNDEFEYLERNIPECFEKGHVWLYEINYRRRFRLRIQLIRCLKKDFQRIIRKDIYRE